MDNYELEPARQLELARKYEHQRCGWEQDDCPVRRLICPGCGRMFHTQQHNRKYCQGEACTKLHRRKLRQQARTDLVCACCGKPFTASRSDAKFCSNACRQKAYREGAK